MQNSADAEEARTRLHRMPRERETRNLAVEIRKPNENQMKTENTPKVTEAHREFAQTLLEQCTNGFGILLEEPTSRILAEYEAAIEVRILAAAEAKYGAALEELLKAVDIMADPNCADWHRKDIAEKLKTNAAVPGASTERKAGE